MKCFCCGKRINNGSASCPYCGTWYGYYKNIDHPKTEEHQNRTLNEKKDYINRIRENPWIDLVMSSTKPIFIFGFSWLLFFLVLMILGLIFG